MSADGHASPGLHDGQTATRLLDLGEVVARHDDGAALGGQRNQELADLGDA